MAPNQEIAVGLDRTHRFIKNKLEPKLARRKRNQTKHKKFVRDIIWEACGHPAYEMWAMELLKVSKDKLALKFLKRSLGTHISAKGNSEELTNT